MTDDRLFSDEELCPWLLEWQNMPEYDMHDLAPKFQIIVNFACAADVEDFGKLIGQPLSAQDGRQLQSVWYPDREYAPLVNKRYVQRVTR